MVNKINLSIIIVSLLLLFLPFCLKTYNFDQNILLVEKRILNKKPKFSIQNLEVSFQKFEKYYNDNFGLRKFFIKSNAKIMDDVFNTIGDEKSKVIQGVNNWLFYTAWNVVEDFQGKIKLDTEKLNKFTDYLTTTRNKLKASNIEYIFVISPKKESIYPEFLPDFIIQNKTDSYPSRLDQIMTNLKTKDSSFPFLDLKYEILKNKKDHILYRTTDTHWNDLGAFFGYQQIINFINSNTQYKAKLLDLNNDFKLTTEMTTQGDLSAILNLKIEYKNYLLKLKNKKSTSASLKTKTTLIGIIDIFKYQNLDQVQITYSKNKQKDLPKVLIIHDSFIAHYLTEEFMESFNEVTFVWAHPCEINVEEIKKQGFNIVIQQTAERYIGGFINKCFKN